MQYEIIISNSTELVRISAKDIMGIRADGNYCYIILNDGEERLIAFQLGQLEQIITEQLGNNASMFIRIGRGVIINYDFLYAISIPKQQLILRSSSGIKATLSASKESLKNLKIFVDNSLKTRIDNE